MRNHFFHAVIAILQSFILAMGIINNYVFSTIVGAIGLFIAILYLNDREIIEWN